VEENSKESDDGGLQSTHRACKEAASRANWLWLGIEVGAIQWFGDTSDPEDDSESVDVFRRDFVERDRRRLYYHWEPEFNAASEGPVEINHGRYSPNWHDAAILFYTLLLNDVWEALVGPEAFEKALDLRYEDRNEEALELLGVLNIGRIAAVEENLRKTIFDAYPYDVDVVEAQLEREYARVLHNQAMRPGRSLVVAGDSDWLVRAAADRREKNIPQLPANHDVLDLCKLLNANSERIASGEFTVIGIARKLTGESAGSDTKAQSLLRQARRYSHLWKARGHSEVRADKIARDS
jgi:hypothetical protein